MIKWFPDSWVPDPDKKINRDDENIINKIVEKLLNDDTMLRLVKQEHDTDINWGYCNERVGLFFKKNENNFKIEFLKVSVYDKKYLYDFHEIFDSYAMCINPNDTTACIEKANKMVGFDIRFYKYKEYEDKSKSFNHFALVNSSGFALGSKDGDSRIQNKLYKYANDKLHLYSEWIKKMLIKHQ